MSILLLLKCNIQNSKKLLHTCQEYDAHESSIILLTDMKLSCNIALVLSTSFCDIVVDDVF